MTVKVQAHTYKTRTTEEWMWYGYEAKRTTMIWFWWSMKLRWCDIYIYLGNGFLVEGWKILGDVFVLIENCLMINDDRPLEDDNSLVTVSHGFCTESYRNLLCVKRLSLNFHWKILRWFFHWTNHPKISFTDINKNGMMNSN